MNCFKSYRFDFSNLTLASIIHYRFLKFQIVYLIINVVVKLYYKTKIVEGVFRI